jgi:hypothetical protein
MNEDPENLTLVFLRRLDGKVDRVIEDMREVKLRLTTVETTLGNLAATEMSHYAITSGRVDRIDFS